MNLYAFSLVIFSGGVLFVSLLVLIKRKDWIGVRFLFFSVAVCGWGFPAAFWINQSYSRDVSLFLTRTSHTFAVFIPITWLHFVFNFIGKRKSKAFYLVSYGIAAFLAIISHRPFFISGMHAILDFKMWTSPGPCYLLFTIFFWTMVPYAFYHLLIAYQKADGPVRDQLKFLVIGTVIGFIAGGNTFLPIYNIPSPQILLAAMPLYPLLMGIGLIRYGLFDVQEFADAFQREKLAAIGTMAASLNHELRNPLFVAKGRIESHLDALERGVYPSKDVEDQNHKKTFETALSHLIRAMEIMQRFSDFAKPFGMGKGDREKVVLKDTFQDVLRLVSNEFEMEKIKLAEVSVDGVSVQANKRQVEEIFFNLIINACHAMGETGGELAIRAHQPPPQFLADAPWGVAHNGKVVVEIEDTGPGIPKENQRRIFEPFYSTKGPKGSGLGLYITKQLIERNQGKISVKSKPGSGTKFTLEFHS